MHRQAPTSHKRIAKESLANKASDKPATSDTDKATDKAKPTRHRQDLSPTSRACPRQALIFPLNIVPLLFDSHLRLPIMAMAGHGWPWPDMAFHDLGAPKNTILKSWMGPGRDPDQIRTKFGKSAQNGPGK